MSEKKNTLFIYSNNNAVCGNCGQHLTPAAKSCPCCSTVFESTEYLNVTDVSDKVMKKDQERRSKIYYSARKSAEVWRINPIVLLIIILVISFALVLLVKYMIASLFGGVI